MISGAAWNNQCQGAYLTLLLILLSKLQYVYDCLQVI